MITYIKLSDTIEYRFVPTGNKETQHYEFLCKALEQKIQIPVLDIQRTSNNDVPESLHVKYLSKKYNIPAATAIQIVKFANDRYDL